MTRRNTAKWNSNRPLTLAKAPIAHPVGQRIRQQSVDGERLCQLQSAHPSPAIGPCQIGRTGMTRIRLSGRKTRSQSGYSAKSCDANSGNYNLKKVRNSSRANCYWRFK